jgi:hypothetical protein
MLRVGEPVVVRIYGDSLSLPRFTDGITCSATYAEGLRSALEGRIPPIAVQLYNRSQAGASIDELFIGYEKDNAYFGIANQVIVIHCGIVDCAPRPIPRKMRRVIGRMPRFIQRPVQWFLHRNRAALQRGGFVWRFTPVGHFAATYRRWLLSALEGGARILAINIAPTNAVTASHSPGLQESITLYNEAIKGVIAAIDAPAIRLIDVHRLIVERDPGMTRFINVRDGHHLTTDAHDLYAAALCDSILDVDPSTPREVAMRPASHAG